jgi:hypothetical protein
MLYLFLALLQVRFPVHGKFCVDYRENCCISMSYFYRSVTIL